MNIKEPDERFLENFLTPSLLSAPEYSIDTPPLTEIKLDQNEIWRDWPADLKKQVIAKLGSSAWNRYPSAFSDNITQKLANQLKVSPQQLLTGPGTNYLISLVLSATTKQLKGGVIISRPSFPLYESHCRYEGIPYKTWDLSEDFAFQVEEVCGLKPHSVLIFASPNNPTGTCLPFAGLEQILQSNPTSIIIADEAYFEFVDQPYTPLLQQYANLILLRTFSKSIGAAGIRFGYILAAASYIKQFKKLRLPYLLNNFTCAAIETILDDEVFHPILKRNIEETSQEREKVYQALAHNSSFMTFPSSANFLLLRWPNQSLCEAAYQKLIARRILVRNVSKGPLLSGCLRVTIGSANENRELISCLSD